MLRIVVVDDHHIVRAGIVALIGRERDMQVVGEADNGRAGIEKVRALSPHVVLMDITMPLMDGIKATQEISNLKPAPKVLVLTEHEQEEYIKRLMQAGANGYLLKSSLAEDLIRAIRSVQKGESFFAPSVSRVMVESFIRTSPFEDSRRFSRDLTDREREILRHIAEGETNLQIAKKLFISVRTVEFHRANLIEKTGVRDIAGLIKYAIQKRLISFEL
jgi:DNA-binding NarL/FixJ family response regulator